MMIRKGLFFEQVNELLQPGYLNLESGYTLLPDGQIYVATHTRMPGSKGEMVEWWFGTYLKDSQTYKQWEPNDHLYFKWDNLWRPGHYIGASQIVEIKIAGVITKMTIKLHDPAEWLDTSMFQKANISAVICGEGFLSDSTLDGRLIHLVRDTDYGCEMRSRFWIAPGPEEVAKGHMVHCLSEMGYLADFLPGLYKKEHKKESKPEVLSKL